MIYNRKGFNFTFNCFTTLSAWKKQAGNGLSDNMNFLACYLSQRINFRLFTKWCFTTSSKETEKSHHKRKKKKKAISFRCTFPLFAFLPPRLWHYYPVFIPLHFILSYMKSEFWTFICLENIFLFESEGASELFFH